MMKDEKQLVGQTKVLEICDDEATEYAILSHRWNDPTEVNYDSMVDLEKMSVEERNEIRQRLGYKKILDTCERAKRDEYEWVWVDTCCIDKRSSAELSEAINSMYRWYANSGVCYAYLHDVHGPSFPAKRADKEYPKSDASANYPTSRLRLLRSCQAHLAYVSPDLVISCAVIGGDC